MELLQIILASGGAFLIGLAAVMTAVKGFRRKSEQAAVDIVDSTSTIIQKLVDGHTQAINLLISRVEQQRKDINENDDNVKEALKLLKELRQELQALKETVRE